MKLVLLFSLLVSSFVSSAASAHPIDCFDVAGGDRVIKWADHLKIALCRKAPSTAPYECFKKAYTDNPDHKLSSTLSVELCQGAGDAAAPVACFYRAIQELKGVNYLQAVKMCSGTTSADDALACFKKAQARFGLDNDNAAALCAH